MKSGLKPLLVWVAGAVLPSCAVPQPDEIRIDTVDGPSSALTTCTTTACCVGTFEINKNTGLPKDGCVDMTDGTNAQYGDPVDAYLGAIARSNGVCTGTGVGAYQCTQFNKDFFQSQLNHPFNVALVDGAHSYGNALAHEKSVIQTEQQALAHGTIPNTDPLFFFTNNEMPQDADFLSQIGGAYGHAVLCEHPVPVEGQPNAWALRIFEVNVAIAGAACHKRVLKVTKNGSTFNISTGLTGYTHNGIIRHNLAGIYGDTGWHEDGTSQAFRDAYQQEGRRLGWGHDNGGSPFVHDVNGITLQDFLNDGKSVNPDPANYVPDSPFGIDGESAIILNEQQSTAYVVKEGFWGTYKCLGQNGMGGTTMLKAPTTGEVTEILDNECNLLPSGTAVVAQHFSDGSCMWWGQGPECPDSSPCIHVHVPGVTVNPQMKSVNCEPVVFVNNPPGPNPQSGDLAPDGDMSQDPMQHGWWPLAYAGNYGNVSTAHVGDTEQLQANGVGQADWTAQFVTHVSIHGGQTLTACLSAKADIAGPVTMFLAQEQSPYANDGLWQVINLATSYPGNPVCTTFTVPAGVSDSHALFGMNFGNHVGKVVIDAMTLQDPTMTDPPSPPPQSGVLAIDGEMKLDPFANGWQILSYQGNWNNVLSAFFPTGGSTGNGSEQLQAKGQGQLNWTAQFVTHVSVQAGQSLTACISGMADIPGMVSMFLAQEQSPYANYGLWEEVNLTAFYPYPAICRTFVANATDAQALFGINFGDHVGPIMVDSLTLTMP